MNRTKAVSIVALAVAVAAVFASAGLGAGTKVRIIKRDIATGKQATARVVITASRPKTIIIETLAQPRQRVTLTWSILCGTLSGEREKHGRLVALTPVKREFALPLRGAAACAVDAKAELAGRGRVTLNVMKRF